MEVYWEARWSRGVQWVCSAVKNGNQELILRETGKGKRSHRSSTHLSSTHFPTTILNSFTASPRGQAHHVMCSTTVPEKRAIPGRPLSGDLH